MTARTWKRLRMQLDLRHRGRSFVRLPVGYHWVPWRSLLIDRHAQVKWRSFRDDLDGRVFRCLSEADGCHNLMREIAVQKTFCPEATWLVVYQPESDWPPADVGSIQGILRAGAVGAIQNVGVVPEHRGQGIGQCLVEQAINGFNDCHMDFATLEVTAENDTAVRLYQRLGFQIREVLYRCGETGKPVPPEQSAFF